MPKGESRAFSAPGWILRGTAKPGSSIRAVRLVACSATACDSASRPMSSPLGEGIETMLSLKSLLPDLPMIAGLSATHLAALHLPPSLRRLYVARDNDPAGRVAMERLQARGSASGIEVRGLVPAFADFNTDLIRFGASALRCRLIPQLHPLDQPRLAAEIATPVVCAL